MYKSIAEFVLSKEKSEIRDIASNGCSGGVSGVIYYRETTAMYDKHSEEIWELLNNAAESQGISIMALIAQFNGGGDVGNDAQFKNLLVWFAVEENARMTFDEANDEADSEHVCDDDCRSNGCYEAPI